MLSLAALLTGIAQWWRTMVLPDAARFNFDAAEYALAGRAWLETGRLVTPFVHPATAGTVPGPPWPLLAGQPLVPALDALAFAVLGRHPDATIAPALLAFVLATLATAMLAGRLTGTSRAAMLGAGLVFACAPWSLRFATVGLTEMPFAALLTATFALLWALPERPRPMLLGLVLGLAHLTRPVLLPLLPALFLGIVLLSPPRARLAALLRTLAVLLPIVALASLLKALSGAGGAHEAGRYLLLNGTSPEFVVSRLNRMLAPPDGIAWLRAHPELFLAKIARNLHASLYAMWTLSGRWPLPCAVIALLAALRAPVPRARAFAFTVLAAAALLLLLDAATVADPRMLFPLFPVTIALAIAALVRVTEWLGTGRRMAVTAAIAIAVLVTLWPTARAWRSPAPPEGPRERDWRGIGQAVRVMLPTTGIIASDAAPWLAWHTGHPATLVPLTIDELDTMPTNLRPAAVVLTDEWLLGRPGEDAWRTLFETRTPPPGWSFAGAASSGRLHAVVFVRTDRARL